MDFEAIAASSADQVEVPAGFRADVLIRYGDQFTDAAGKELTFGYNNDYLAFFPIEGSSDEGILFVNHEYPGPFFMNGYKPTGVEQPGGSASHNKSTADIREERKSVGNSFLHIARGTDGIWGIVEGSEFNRRIYGDSPIIPMTGPLAKPTSEGGVGTTSNGSLANCSGGITPWGTALSCEENYDGYGIALGSQDFFYGWDNVDGLRYDQNANKTYGWVVEHDPYDPEDVGRKHTALGRFRHENTAFRVVPDKPFVLYMGDDANNEGVYKFVSDREFDPAETDAARANNMQILSEGTLYIAEWTRNDNTTLGAGRTVYTSEGGPRAATSPSEGRGRWILVEDADLEDTRAKLRARYASGQNVERYTPAPGDKHDPSRANTGDTIPITAANDYPARFATNRPEDVEVDDAGTVYIALTNNRGGSDNSSRGSQPAANDRHGLIRRLVEDSADPMALTFAWTDWSVGGPRNTADPGEQGFSSPDNLVFDTHDNVWVVTDISSDALKGSLAPVTAYDYHRNNAVFMIPRTGANQGIAFRFANMPVEAEGTGPYFTPDEQTLFVNVQHPGEESEPGDITSYWPRGNKTAEQNPNEPIPSMVAITKVPPRAQDPGSPVVPPPPPGQNPDGTPAAPSRDATLPFLQILSPARQSLRALRRSGMTVRVRVDEPVTLRVTVSGRLSRRKGGRGPIKRFARDTVRVERAGEATITLRPSAAQRLLLRREDSVPAVLSLSATDAAGNERTRTKQLRFT
jgi:hypothetical protein